MNERIKELAKQARLPKIDGEWDYNARNLLRKDGEEWRVAVPSEIISTMIQSERGLEKFAELIVRDCIDWCNAHAGIEGTAQKIVESIKEHFGVEE